MVDRFIIPVFSNIVVASSLHKTILCVRGEVDEIEGNLRRLGLAASVKKVFASHEKCPYVMEFPSQNPSRMLFWPARLDEIMVRLPGLFISPTVKDARSLFRGDEAFHGLLTLTEMAQLWFYGKDRACTQESLH